MKEKDPYDLSDIDEESQSATVNQRIKVCISIIFISYPFQQDFQCN